VDLSRLDADPLISFIAIKGSQHLEGAKPYRSFRFLFAFFGFARI
jgi:hypothetical protein